ATLALGALVPADRGFRARYFADAEARGPIESSPDYRSRAFTRVDARLDFSPRGAEFPLTFFNDIARFNFTGSNQPDRQKLPFDAGSIATRRLDGWQTALATFVRVSRTAFDVCALTWLALLVALDLNDLRLRRHADGRSMSLRQQTLACFAVVATLEAYLVAA